MVTWDVLKYGAIGIGAVVIYYSSTLLNTELKRPDPRPRAQGMIYMFMGLGLIMFIIAAGIGLRERSIDMVQEINRKVAEATEPLNKQIQGLGDQLRTMEAVRAKNCQELQPSLGDIERTLASMDDLTKKRIAELDADEQTERKIATPAWSQHQDIYFTHWTMADTDHAESQSLRNSVQLAILAAEKTLREVNDACLRLTSR